jgi:hypothetical protein
MRVDTLASERLRLTRSTTVGAQARLTYRARTGGVYYLEAKLGSKLRDPLVYRLAVARR